MLGWGCNTGGSRTEKDLESMMGVYVMKSPDESIKNIVSKKIDDSIVNLHKLLKEVGKEGRKSIQNSDKEIIKVEEVVWLFGRKKEKYV